ncbi:MAG TPA: sugar ABC transporter ATP-binding protein [Candidatus Brocadiia bacterium]|nr:sugar ABC transporter ATP-binding protein [Candidatus Brocadiia bacterium]
MADIEQDRPRPVVLEARGIHKSFGGVEVLHGVDVELRRGTVHAIIGENGAGKSTLMKILAGAYQQDAGRIMLEGREIRMKKPIQALHAGIVMIHQELNLAPHLTAAENLFLGREPLLIPPLPILDRKRVFEESRRLAEEHGFRFDTSEKISNLSVAQAQLVEILKAIARGGKVLIMDEPTSSLSGGEVEDLLRTVIELKRKNVSILYISHRIEEIFCVADEVTVLRDGRKVFHSAVSETNEANLVRQMVGRDLEDFYPEKKRAAGRPMLKVESLSSEGGFEGVSFEVRSGEIVGISGLVGAGRTEVAETIFGARPATGGRMLLEGGEIRPRSPRDAIRMGIGLATEDRKRTGLFLPLSLIANITAANVPAMTAGGVVMRRGRQARTAKALINDLSVRCRGPRDPARSLSGGNQQKVVLAKWLCCDSKVLILDEPTRGIDVGAKVEIYKLMERLAEEGRAILVVSSELPELLGITDRILVMRRGRLVAELESARTNEEEVMGYAALVGQTAVHASATP